MKLLFLFTFIFFLIFFAFFSLSQMKHACIGNMVEQLLENMVGFPNSNNVKFPSAGPIIVFLNFISSFYTLLSIKYE